MPTVDELLTAYRAAFRTGDTDPAPFLAQVAGTDRRELAVRIDAFLDDAPAPDPAGFAAFIAEDPLAERTRAAVETWPALLPARRTAASLPRSSLVAQLAELLGVGDRAEKVGRYYHRMETGSLPAAGVDERVLEALARLLGVTAQRLRAAGERTLPPGAGTVFARSAEPLAPAAVPAEPVAARLAAQDPPDEVDRLFTDAG